MKVSKTPIVLFSLVVSAFAMSNERYTNCTQCDPCIAERRVPFKQVLHKVDFDDSCNSDTPADDFNFRHPNSTRLVKLYRDLYN